MENKIDCEMSLKNCYAALSPNTSFAYKLTLNDFLKFMNIGMNEIINISKTDIIRYAAELEKKYNSGSFIVKIAALRKIFNELEKNIIGYTSPFKAMSKIEKHLLHKITNKKINHGDLLSESEIEKVLNYLSDKYKQTNSIYFFQIHLIFNLLVKTGLRISELVNAKKKDISNINGVYYLHIREKKNKERRLIISDSIYKMLCIYNQLNNNQTEYLITTQTNKKLSRKKIYSIIQKNGVKIINKSVSPSILRHTFAVYHLINKKRFLPAVCKYLGNSSIIGTVILYF